MATTLAHLRIIPRVCISFFCVSSLTQQSAKTEEPCHIEASSLRYLPDSRQVQADGAVHIRHGGFALHGTSATYDAAHQTLTASGPSLRLVGPRLTLQSQLILYDFKTRRLNLQAPSVWLNSWRLEISGSWADCHNDACRIVDATLHPCSSSSLFIQADKVVASPDQTLMVTGLRVGARNRSVPLFNRLRLVPPEDPGFLVPVVRFSPKAGLIAGPRGVVPYGAEGSLHGYVALRSRQGFETASYMTHPNLKMGVETVTIGAATDLRLRGTTSFGSETTPSFTAALDWVKGHRRIIDELHIDPTAHAATHTKSLFALTQQLDVATIESYLQLHQPFLSSGFVTQRPHTVLGFQLSMPALSGWRPIYPAMTFGVSRTMPSAPFSPASLRGLASHTLIYVNPSLHAAFPLGPFPLAFETALYAGVLIPDTDPARHFSQTGIRNQLRIDFPLQRHYASTTHRITPYAVWTHQDLLPSTHAAPPGNPFEALHSAQEVVVGVSNRLSWRKGGGRARLDVYEKMKAYRGIAFRPHYIAGSGELDLQHFYVSFDSAFDHTTRSASLLGVSVSHRSTRTRNAFSFRQVGHGAGPHLDPPMTLDLYFDFEASDPEAVQPRKEIFFETQLTASSTLTLEGGARLGVYPSLENHAAWYGFTLRIICDRVSLRVRFFHDASSAIPALQSSLTIDPF